MWQTITTTDRNDLIKAGNAFVFIKKITKICLNILDIYALLWYNRIKNKKRKFRALTANKSDIKRRTIL